MIDCETLAIAEELVRSITAISVSPGFTWGRSGNISRGTYLLNDTVPSNNVGRVVPISSGVIEKVFIALEVAATVTFDIQKRTGATLTTLGSVTITSARTTTVDTSIAVTFGDEIAIRVAPGSTDAAKNPVLGVIIKGSLV